MFTGIVQGVAPIIAIEQKENFRTHVIKLPNELLTNLALGASVAHNGCCLTVTEIEGNLVSFDLMQETLRVTNLGQLTVGDKINIERAAKIGDEIGGHLMSGHISCCAEITNIIKHKINYQIELTLPKLFMPYVLPKGFIAIDGISLTIGKVEGEHFWVHLIPETLHRTTIGNKPLGSKVNIEIDSQTQAIVNTVRSILEQKNTNTTCIINNNTD